MRPHTRGDVVAHTIVISPAILVQPCVFAIALCGGRARQVVCVGVAIALWKAVLMAALSSGGWVLGCVTVFMAGGALSNFVSISQGTNARGKMS